MQIPKRAARGSSTAHTTSSFLAPCMVECDRCTRSSCCLKATPHFWFVCDTLVTESCEQYHATVLNRCEVGKCVLVVRSNAHPTLSLRSGEVCPCCALKRAPDPLLHAWHGQVCPCCALKRAPNPLLHAWHGACRPLALAEVDASSTCVSNFDQNDCVNVCTIYSTPCIIASNCSASMHYQANGWAGVSACHVACCGCE
jgi:hypothetical protein